MPKKRTPYRRARSVVRRVTHHASGIGGGKFGPVIAGAVGGLASQIGNRFLPGYGSPLGMGAVGYFMNNPTLLTLAGVNLSAMIPIGGLLGGSTSTGGGAI